MENKNIIVGNDGHPVVTDNLPIYPKIVSYRAKNTLKLTTILRKKHRGKYYLWNFHRSAYVPEGQNDLSAAISSFNRDIYMCMLYGKVDTKATYQDGEKVFKLDKNQMDEKLRMKPLDFIKEQ
jgi:hypothetical protein